MKSLLSSVLRVRTQRVSVQSTISLANHQLLHNRRPRWFSSAGFLQHWKTQVQEGRLRPDKAQEKVAKRLNRLQEAMVGYSNEAFFVRPTILEEELAEKDKLNTKEDEESHPTKTEETPKEPPLAPLPRIPRGLYIHGPVGTGKSLLMDTFYNTIQTPTKARYHFHAFMAEIHARIHKLNQDDLLQKGRNFSVDTSKQHNPIIRVAMEFSKHTTLLCLDEFQVTDVADALILKQLFEVLFAQGTVVVATSNRSPGYLYEGGLNYNYFAPFIDLLERHCIVHSLESKLGDYRQVLSDEQSTTPASDQSSLLENGPFFFGKEHSAKDFHSTIQKLCHEIYPDDPYVLESFDWTIGFGRTLRVPLGDPKGLVAVFSFEELCDCDLGASDYRAIAQHFSIIAVEFIPPLNTFHHNRARRFITLIDELYEGKCALVCSTTVHRPKDLFQLSSSEEQQQDEEDATESVDLGDTLGMEDIQTQGGQPVSTLASVRELSFAFRRAASRITEITSQRWWKQVLEKDGWMVGYERLR